MRQPTQELARSLLRVGAAAMAGITTGVDSIVRAVGVRPGTGEFDGMLIHEVLHLIVDDAFNVTGTIRSTVYPAE